MVGSLLRTAPVKEARDKKAAGQIKAAELAQIENAEIAALVKKQEAVGLQAVDRRRVPARLLAFRFSRESHRRAGLRE